MIYEDQLLYFIIYPTAIVLGHILEVILQIN